MANSDWRFNCLDDMKIKLFVKKEKDDLCAEFEKYYWRKGVTSAVSSVLTNLCDPAIHVEDALLFPRSETFSTSPGEFQKT